MGALSAWDSSPGTVAALQWTYTRITMLPSNFKGLVHSWQPSKHFRICRALGLGDEWPIDPREQKLGYRKIMGENDKPKAEAAFLEPGLAPVESEAEAYKVWRLQKGIAEGSEIPSGWLQSHALLTYQGHVHHVQAAVRKLCSSPGSLHDAFVGGPIDIKGLQQCWSHPGFWD